MEEMKKRYLERMSAQIRKTALETIQTAGSGHIGGSFSIAEILSVLYFDKMQVDPADPKRENRDRFVISKGHCSPAVYTTLALRGFFPAEHLKTFREITSDLSGHVEMHVPGVDMSTGSLGQGLSVALGMALYGKCKGYQNHVYCVLGDGEIQEGQVWEAAMFTAAKKITNLVWLVDNNKKQLDGYVKDVLDSGDLRAKFEAFGFDALRIDGNDLGQLYDALTKKAEDKPIAIILDTVKGRGVTEVEETMANHSMTVAEDVFDRWLSELNGQLEALS